MITKEQLQAMSDFEVNRAIADLTNVKWQISAVDDECLMVGSEVLDYCNTPNDIMPLAFEHRLEIDWFADGRCLVGAGDFMYQSLNPLRAIACCLILVLQEKRNG